MGNYCFKRLTNQRCILEFRIGPRQKIFEIMIQGSIPGTETLPKARRSLAEPWTGGEHTGVLAAGWLSECLGSHMSCNNLPSSNWRPSRLLDVSTDRIRLVLATTESTKGPYATLSHCWGQEEFLVLNSKNIPYFLAGISTDQFPLTFREAITAVRRLGIRYLWIDCYCIIQGTDAVAQADWALASEQMGQVYSNSLINIGAAHGSGPREGLFTIRRQQQGRCSFPFKFRLSPGSDANWYFLAAMGESWSPLHCAFLDLYESPLMKRAWVLQECVLSPRMLSFTQTQLFWQCSELAACETLPYHRVENDDHWTGKYPFWALARPPDLSGFIDISLSEAYHTGVRIDRRSVQERWFKTLGSYSKAGLSYPDKDIFKAIDGVGRHIATLTGDIYSHGMLQKTIPQALLWSSIEYQYGHRSQDGRAPTWHWASYDGDISFNKITNLYKGMRWGLQNPSEQVKTRFHPLVHVFLTSNCEISTLDTASEIDFWPHLICIGRLIKVKLQENTDDEDKPPFSAITQSHIQLQKVHIDDHEIMRANIDKATAILPLIESRITDLRPVNLPNRFMVKSILSILVQDTGEGIFHRVGMCSHDRANLFKEISNAKPGLIVLK